MSSSQPGSEVVLVRHGETEWSKSGQHTGRTDVPMTEKGREQAACIARSKHVVNRSFTLVLSSPLSRAWETCQLAGLASQAHVEQTDDVLEWDYGIAEGRTTADIRKEIPGWSVWTHGCPGGETVEEVGARADRALATARAAGGTVAIVAHGHMLRILATRWIGLPPNDARLFALSTASVSVLGWEREQPVFEVWNDTSHFL